VPFCRQTPLTLQALRTKDYSQDPQTLGEHLKKRRRELGLLQLEAAEQMGIEIWTYIRVDHARADEVLILAGRGIEAPVVVVLLQQRADDQRTILAADLDLGAGPFAEQDAVAGQSQKLALIANGKRYLAQRRRCMLNWD